MGREIAEINKYLDKLVNYYMGLVMRETNRNADPSVAREIIREILIYKLADSYDENR